MVQKDTWGCAWIALCNIWKKFNGSISNAMIKEFENCSAKVNKKNFLLFFDYLDLICKKLDIKYNLLEHKTHLGLCRAIRKKIDNGGFIAFIVNNDTPHVFLLEKGTNEENFKSINMFSDYKCATKYIKRSHFFSVIYESRKYFPFLVFNFKKNEED